MRGSGGRRRVLLLLLIAGTTVVDGLRIGHEELLEVRPAEELAGLTSRASGIGVVTHL